MESLRSLCVAKNDATTRTHTHRHIMQQLVRSPIGLGADPPASCAASRLHHFKSCGERSSAATHPSCSDATIFGFNRVARLCVRLVNVWRIDPVRRGGLAELVRVSGKGLKVSRTNGWRNTCCLHQFLLADQTSWAELAGAHSRPVQCVKVMQATSSKKWRVIQ